MTEVNHQDCLGWTALIWAAKQNDIDSVRKLLKHDADPYQSDHAGRTAIQWAAAPTTTLSFAESNLTKITLKDRLIP
ncbi:ankyrin repeat domain-containing protein [Vreelandella salicampi]|uniref:Ankyrin repeat domain-containing protein n=1 Tax=Vreelandella salicampi TaxID=1449798 RepID=A0A7Z0LME9_9GAMM|nr:ankyrin repeat domain-containing protein [Halomonas salicampi]